MALVELGKNSLNQDVIRENGGIKGLIKVSQQAGLASSQGSLNAQAYALCALDNLAQNSSRNQDMIREEQGIETMIQLIGERSQAFSYIV